MCKTQYARMKQGSVFFMLLAVQKVTDDRPSGVSQMHTDLMHATRARLGFNPRPVFSALEHLEIGVREIAA
jgi:hypothetical protein